MHTLILSAFALLGTSGAFDGGSVALVTKGARSPSRVAGLAPAPRPRAAPQPAAPRGAVSPVSVEEWLTVEVATY